MKILAIGAHPDDIEIFMYGLLSICHERGDEIFIIVATDGAAGNVKINKNLKKIRQKETKDGLKLIGEPIFLNFPDGKLLETCESREKLTKKIKNINPDLIITHPPEDYHPDHRALSAIVTNSCGFECPVIFCETLMGVNFVPNYYIDISKYFKRKSEAILNHKSQEPIKFVKSIKIINRFRSAQCNGPEGTYAEVYRFESRFPFQDVRSLLPNSPKIRPFYKGELESLI